MDVDIAQRLMQRRKQAGFSQEALAEKLGVSRQAVSKWERSESSPDTDNLILLAQLYGISLDELLFDTPPAARDGAEAESEPAAEAEGPGPVGTRTEAGGDADAGSEDSKPKVNIGFDGVHVEDKDDYVHVSWADGVNINGEHFASWKEAHDSYHFDGGTSKKSAFEKSWNRFPFPLLVLIAFFALGGFGVCPWGPLFLLFFTIPVYYVIGSSIGRRSPAMFVQGVYPMAALAGFCYAALVLGAPSPAWLLIVSIPLVALLVHSLSKWWRHRKKGK